MERTEWYVVAMAGAGVQFTGSREEAQATLDRLTQTIQQMFKDRGITYINKGQYVVPKVDEEDDGTPLPL